MASPFETLSQHRSFGGVVGFYRHAAEATACAMRFAVFTPPQATATRPVPVLYYLAGLTCTEETFIVKAGAQRLAAELGLMLVAPDTSPRGVPLPGDSDSWDFGVGAGFYLDATVEPWSRHYRMYSYVTRELPALIEAGFPADPKRVGIFGHSMGGHGALTIALKNPDRYSSVSAFAPGDALAVSRLRLAPRRSGPATLATARRRRTRRASSTTRTVRSGDSPRASPPTPPGARAQ